MDVLYTNPANFDLISRETQSDGRPSSLDLTGMRIVACPFIQPTQEAKTGRILWPEDRFVEYEPDDAAWAVPLGLATEETEEKMLIYAIDYRQMMAYSHSLLSADF